MDSSDPKDAARKILEKIESVEGDEKEGLEAVEPVYEEKEKEETPAGETPSVFFTRNEPARAETPSSLVPRPSETIEPSGPARIHGVALKDPARFDKRLARCLPQPAREKPTVAQQEAHKAERAKTGIDGLDELLGGGIPRGSVVLLEGGTGTGKTIFALQFLVKGAEEGEPGIFLSLSETAENLGRTAKQFGWNLDQFEKENLLKIICRQPHEAGEASKVIGGEFRYAAKHLAAKRIAVDSLSAMQSAAKEGGNAAHELFKELKRLAATSIVTQAAEGAATAVEEEADGIIALSVAEADNARVLEIGKMRLTGHDSLPHRFEIGRAGIKVLA